MTIPKVLIDATISAVTAYCRIAIVLRHSKVAENCTIRLDSWRINADLVRSISNGVLSIQRARVF